MTKIVVTGSSGFIGKRLVEVLLERGNPPYCLGNLIDVVDRDWRDSNNLSSGPYVVYHLAAKTGVSDSWNHIQEVLDVNVQVTQRVLEFCRQTESSLVFLSSATYADSSEYASFHEDQTLCVNNPYALSKHLAEQLCEFYANECEVPVTVLRPFNVYGPRQSNRFLIPHVISQIREHSKVSVENLHTKRDYVYIDDVVEAIMKCNKSQSGFRVYNVGTGISHSVRELLEHISKIVDERFEITDRKEKRKNETTYSRANIDRIRIDLSWKPQVSIAEGLRRIISSDAPSLLSN